MAENDEYYVNQLLHTDPFPFRVGKVRTAFPGWLNGEFTVYDPREKYDRYVWHLVTKETESIKLKQRA